MGIAVGIDPALSASEFTFALVGDLPAVRVVDVSMESDDLSFEVITDEIKNAEQLHCTVGEIRLRQEQLDNLQRSLQQAHQPLVTTIFGAKVIVIEDGLTPRQRQIKRAEREHPTRQQQIETFIRHEREALNFLRNHLKNADAAARESATVVPEAPTISWGTNHTFKLIGGDPA